MLPTTLIKAALYDWLGDSQSLPVIWEFQNAPQPGSAFVSVNPIVSVTKLGAYDEFVPNYDTGGGYMAQHWQVMSSVNAFGVNAIKELSKAIDALGKPSLYKVWFQDREIQANIGTMRNLSGLKNSRFEQRAQLDVTLTCLGVATDDGSLPSVNPITDNPGYFDHLVYSSTSSCSGLCPLRPLCCRSLSMQLEKDQVPCSLA